MITSAHETQYETRTAATDHFRVGPFVSHLRVIRPRKEIGKHITQTGIDLPHPRSSNDRLM